MKGHNCGKTLEIARPARDATGGGRISGAFGAARHPVDFESVDTCEGAGYSQAPIRSRAVTAVAAVAAVVR